MRDNWDYYIRNRTQGADALTSQDGRSFVLFDSITPAERPSFGVHEPFHSNIVGYIDLAEPYNPTRYQQFVSDLAGIPYPRSLVESMNAIRDSLRVTPTEPLRLTPQPSERRGPRLDLE